jgi:DNA processing protein
MLGRSSQTPIYLRGTLPDGAPRIAVVGARAASRAGMDHARRLAAGLAGRGAVVISGGALGIDAAAHAGCLSRTIVVLASTLETPYPARNIPLFDAVVAAGGALVTQAAPGTRLQRFHFPRRNELIATMSDAVVIIEAGATSGSLHTARCAHELGRVLLAVPGSPGTDALLATGAAALAESVDDVFAALRGEPRRPERDAAPDVDGAGVDSDEGRALQALDLRASRDLEDVARLSGLGVRRVQQALCALELDGHVLLCPGGGYVRA